MNPNSSKDKNGRLNSVEKLLHKPKLNNVLVTAQMCIKYCTNLYTVYVYIYIICIYILLTDTGYVWYVFVCVSLNFQV